MILEKDLEVVLKENERLIYKIASKYAGIHSIDDLFQAGFIGLRNAYVNYNNTENSKFSTYAYKYILGEILEYIKRDRNIKVSRDSLKICKMYEISKEKLMQVYRRVPSFSEIAKFMEISEIELSQAISSSEYTLSTDQELTDSEGYTFIDAYGVDNTKNIDDLIDLKKYLLDLDEHERRLIELRYFKDYTQSEVANMLGVSQVQVSRCESKVLTKIRNSVVC